ncbi:MAG: hypothetical protein ACK41U_12400 [Paracoccus sp. (in: a-proteobacteria)]|uniref:hypothetical protein n=1 Tax=Paracoccus sp. TaxID=267 RepID=UPI00391CD561
MEDLKPLIGAKFVRMSVTQEDETRIKSLTAGEPLRVRPTFTAGDDQSPLSSAGMQGR